MPATGQKRIKTREELERRILHGLACEWETALWNLSETHRKRMKRPLFGLGSMKGRCGYWSPEKREIRLSRELVLNHPWDSVREVLLHEMAHQLAQEVLDSVGESPHGPEFRRACHLLRADSRASVEWSPLDERIARCGNGPQDSILRRVKKLMALAQSRNRHEAEAAMAKARELVLKYNADIIERQESREHVSVFVGRPALRHPRYHYRLACLLQDFYLVCGIWVPAYVLEKGKMGRVLEISGTADNVQTAGYVHDFVLNFIDARWRKYNENSGLSLHRKTDFADGIIRGFIEKLKERECEKKAGAENLDLVSIQDPLLMEHMAHRYPHTTKFSRRVSGLDKRVLQDGMRAGRRMVISKGIVEKRPGRRLLTQAPSSKSLGT